MAACGAWVSLVLFASSTSAEPLTIKILGAGYFENGPIESMEAAPDTVVGMVKHPATSRLIEATTTICARLGRSFGVDYEVAGGKTGAPVKVQQVTVFPPEGLTKPDGKTVRISRFESSIVIGTPANRTYSFDEAWEMVDGVWVFEFHVAGKLIGQQRFTVMTRCEIS